MTRATDYLPNSRRWLLIPALLGSLVACKGPPPPPREGQQPVSREAVAAPSEPMQTIALADVELQLPASWQLLPDQEANFALIRAPGDAPPMCTLELRRQREHRVATAGGKQDRGDYRRGTLRGRVQQIDTGESEAVVLHCLAPHGRAWAAIDAAFDSLRSGKLVVAAPPSPANDGPIVELCTGSPVQRTHVCVRRRDGAVYCGDSESDQLARVPELAPSVQIGCDGMRACSRAASGAVSCWTAAGPPPALLDSVGAARDLAGGCIVDERGKVVCREHRLDGSTTEHWVELLPLGDPAHALSDVEQVLAGSNREQGCVLGQGQLRCWDHRDTLHLSLPDEPGAHVVEAPADARDLAMIGERVCVAGPTQWTCLHDHARDVLDDCQQRSCGCSLVGAMRLSCEHEPHTRPNAQPFGRIADVVAVEHACAALRDGTVVCRGSASGQAEAQPDIAARIIGGTPGVLHALRLVD